MYDYLSNEGRVVYVHRMSHPLKLLGSQMILDKKFATESLKDAAMNDQGTTYRQVQIALFNLGAGLFGLDWLGKHYVTAVHGFRRADFLIMPDCGRLEDLSALFSAKLPFGHVRVHREGTTYVGDSRRDFFLQTTCHIDNNGTLSHLQAQASTYAKMLIAHAKPVVADEDLTKV